jgi:hypothetical protein
MPKLIITLIFKNAKKYFSPKLGKNCGKCEHNIDPRVCRPVTYFRMSSGGGSRFEPMPPNPEFPESEKRIGGTDSCIGDSGGEVRVQRPILNFATSELA